MAQPPVGTNAPVTSSSARTISDQWNAVDTPGNPDVVAQAQGIADRFIGAHASGSTADFAALAHAVDEAGALAQQVKQKIAHDRNPSGNPNDALMTDIMNRGTKTPQTPEEKAVNALLSHLQTAYLNANAALSK